MLAVQEQNEQTLTRRQEKNFIYLMPTVMLLVQRGEGMGKGKRIIDVRAAQSFMGVPTTQRAHSTTCT